MAAAPGQNATVEEILASIRQAISEDDAKRTNERMRDPRALPEKKPTATVTSIAAEKKPEPKPEPVEAVAEVPAEISATEASLDQDFVEQAIEQALDGVRAELENHTRASRPARVQQSTVEIGAAAAQRAVPRAARAGMAAVRREVPLNNPRRALLSPRTDAHVAASFEDLSKAMMGGNARKLDEVVEELLQPMLKGWLESNLPQMVERLVREEIERVSRGQR